MKCETLMAFSGFKEDVNLLKSIQRTFKTGNWYEDDKFQRWNTCSFDKIYISCVPYVPPPPYSTWKCFANKNLGDTRESFANICEPYVVLLGQLTREVCLGWLYFTAKGHDHKIVRAFANV